MRIWARACALPTFAFRMKISFGLLFLLPFFASAQRPQFPIDWKDAPVLHTIPDSFRTESAVIVLEGRQTEYMQHKGDIVVFETTQRIARLQDDKGAEGFNTMSVPKLPGREITVIKARTILPNGTVREVDRDKIRTQKNEEGYEEYLIALEGVEVGSEVELLYTEKRPFAVFGSERYQFSIPVARASFRLIAPTALRFETKGYNGFPTADDMVDGDVRIYSAVARGLRGIREEPYGTPEAHAANIGYRLSYVTGGSTFVRQYTWNDLAGSLYETYYDYPSKDQDIAKRYLSDVLDVRRADPEEEKIRRIEDRLKKAISIETGLPDEDAAEEFSAIVKKKVTTERGFTRFMVACLQEAGVKGEIGLTRPRTDGPVDETFENYALLSEYLIYFPSTKSYLAPSAVTYRYPFYPWVLAGNKGVFAKAPVGISPATGAVRTIPTPDADASSYGIDATVTFEGADLTPRIRLVNTFLGHSAAGIRDAFVFLPKDKEKEVVKSVVDVAATEEDILEYAVEGAAFSNYSTGKPLRISSSVRAPGLLEKAGPKYLFKVGDVIGRQAEMYADEARRLPIDINYPHALVRTIRITPPAGYRVANPGDARKKVTHGPTGAETLGFVSDYTTEADGTVVISIREFYNDLLYPISDIEPFRGVINAAADFNKVTLVLEKK